MKLVASSKLRKAQQAIVGMRPYQQRLDNMMARLTAEVGEDFSTPIVEARPVRHAVVVCLSSNSSLCGAFNSNVIKATFAVVDQLREQGSAVEIIPIGQKIAEQQKLDDNLEDALSKAIEEFKETARELVLKSRAEEGNVCYTLNQSCADENTFAFIECWKDEAAIRFHNGTEHFTGILPKLAALCEEGAPADLFTEIEY